MAEVAAVGGWAERLIHCHPLELRVERYREAETRAVWLAALSLLLCLHSAAIESSGRARARQGQRNGVQPPEVSEATQAN